MIGGDLPVEPRDSRPPRDVAHPRNESRPELTERVTIPDSVEMFSKVTTSSDRACLVVIYGPELGRRASLGQGAFEIGRSSRSDLPIDQESISRHHARITFDGKRHVIEDLGST